MSNMTHSQNIVIRICSVQPTKHLKQVFVIWILERNIPANLNIPPPNLQQQIGAEKQLPSLLSLKVDPPDQLNPEGGSEESGEVILAQALEDVLALKNQRERELGTEDANNTDASQNKGTDEKDDEDNTVSLFYIS